MSLFLYFLNEKLDYNALAQNVTDNELFEGNRDIKTRQEYRPWTGAKPSKPIKTKQGFIIPEDHFVQETSYKADFKRVRCIPRGMEKSEQRHDNNNQIDGFPSALFVVVHN
ncbi:map6 domain-containing protein 1 [Limosa lapponica baueri]|uniref:Map6 domain-containing protein 1 n=1 Tax=Limosa lapponica baueri TaxID=1758121 RepID=A0A2I0TV00_LIMLA|nr:map6 domain-containing protein 1 [Limosa lapponica baueri]